MDQPGRELKITGTVNRFPARCSPDQAPVFLVANHPGNGVADLLEPTKIPEIWEVTALLRLHRMNRARLAIEKNAFTVWLVLQRKAVSIRPKPGELLNESKLAGVHKGCHPGHLRIRQADLPRPSTASRTTLAFVENGHQLRLPSVPRPCFATAERIPQQPCSRRTTSLHSGRDAPGNPRNRNRS